MFGDAQRLWRPDPNPYDDAEKGCEMQVAPAEMSLARRSSTSSHYGVFRQTHTQPPGIAWLRMREDAESGQPSVHGRPASCSVPASAPLDLLDEDDFPLAPSDLMAAPMPAAKKRKLRVHTSMNSMNFSPRVSRRHPVSFLTPILEQDGEAVPRPVSTAATSSDVSTVYLSAAEEFAPTQSPVQRLTPPPFISRPARRTDSQTSIRSNGTARSANQAFADTSFGSLRHAEEEEADSPVESIHIVGPGPFGLVPDVVRNSDLPEIVDTDSSDRDSIGAESFMTAASSREVAVPDSPAQSFRTADDGVSEASSDARKEKHIQRAREFGSSRRATRMTRKSEAVAGLDQFVTCCGIRTRMQKRTPAFWCFWFGFACPMLWLFGGWYFTSHLRMIYQSSHLTGGEKFYLSFKASSQPTEPAASPRLRDEYPMIPFNNGWPEPKRKASLCSIPNAVWDRVPGVKLGYRARGVGVTPPRWLVVDPWIQRCRYSFCYFMIVLALGTCLGSVLLVVFMVRRLYT